VYSRKKVAQKVERWLVPPPLTGVGITLVGYDNGVKN